jgi:hypothetical protein
MLLVSTAEAVNHWWPRLVGAGDDAGVDAGTAAVARAGGHYAQEALRIARGIPRHGQEVTPFSREPATLAAFASPLGVAGFGSHEVVLAGNQAVGEITSRAWVCEWPATLSLALLHPEAAQEPHLEFVADGKRWPLTRRATRWEAMLRHRDVDGGRANVGRTHSPPHVNI